MIEYTLGGIPIGAPELVTPNFLYTGKMSTFGGPKDIGVSPTEGLALFDHSDTQTEQFSFLFGHYKVGLARMLNPSAFYCAMRWDYTKSSRQLLREEGIVEVTNANGKMIWVTPVDWGPNIRTGRIIDLSPGAAFQLGLKTDDVVSVKLVFGSRATLVG